MSHFIHNLINNIIIITLVSKLFSLLLGRLLLFGDTKNHLAAASIEGNCDAAHGRTNLPFTFLALGYSSEGTGSCWFVADDVVCWLWR